MIEELNFKTLEELINTFKSNENIIGIVEYGGRNFSNMEVGGDYDLTIVLEKPISKNFFGVHFHINKIPVDCMILSKEDFESETPLSDFLLVHLNCKILFDRNGELKVLLERIKEKWTPSKELGDFERNLYRFTFRHILDKLKYRLYDNELYSKFFIFSSLDWFINSYGRIKNWEIGKPKLYFKLIEEEEKELFNIISEIYDSRDLERQFILLKECGEYMLSSIGGLWENNEVLFHLKGDGINDYEEQNKFINEFLM